MSAVDPSRPIRVLRVIARLNIGGPAIHATLLTTRLDRLRFSTTLVTGIEAVDDGNYLTLRGRQADLEIIPGLGHEIRPLQDLRTVWTLVRLMRRVRPDIVHTHTAKAGTVGRLAAILCRRAGGRAHLSRPRAPRLLHGPEDRRLPAPSSAGWRGGPTAC